MNTYPLRIRRMALGFVLIGGLAVYVGTRSVLDENTPGSAVSRAASTGPDHKPEMTGFVPLNRTEPPNFSAPQKAPTIELSTGILEWEKQLDAVVKEAPDPTAAARAIIGLIPKLPDEAVESATERAVEKLPDASYTSVALPVLTNPRTHGRVLSVLFADLMDRPDQVSLPALLQIAKDGTHALAPYALDNLRLLLEADYSSDWSKWDDAVRRRLSTKAEISIQR